MRHLSIEFTPPCPRLKLGRGEDALLKAEAQRPTGPPPYPTPTPSTPLLDVSSLTVKKTQNLSSTSIVQANNGETHFSGLTCSRSVIFVGK